MPTRHERRVLAASWVLPVCAPPIRDGAVSLRDGRIEWVGRAADAPAPAEDLGVGVLMPGLVNAHCHLELSHLQGLRSSPAGFVPWIESLVAARASSEPGRAGAALDAAVAFLEEETGTIAVGDISNTLESVPPLAASGLRAAIFHELIGWDPTRADEAIRAAQERRRTVHSNGRVRLHWAAHAPHSVSPALLAKLREQGGPAAIHLAESPAETRFFRDGGGEWPAFLERRGLGGVAFDPPGCSPVQYLDRLGLLRDGLLAAHAVQVDDADAATLARRGVAVVVCPSSNRNLGVGVAPVPRLRAAGVRVCLGTDSVASGDSLDVAREMRELQRTFPELEPRAIVEMATIAGARALGFAEIGTIEPGQAAALAFAAASAEPADPEAFVVAGAGRIRRVA